MLYTKSQQHIPPGNRKAVKSTVLSLSRDIVFLCPLVVVLSLKFGVTGMLFAAPIADILAFIFTIILIYHEINQLRNWKIKIIKLVLKKPCHKTRLKLFFLC